MEIFDWKWCRGKSYLDIPPGHIYLLLYYRKFMQGDGFRSQTCPERGDTTYLRQIKLSYQSILHILNGKLFRERSYLSVPIGHLRFLIISKNIYMRRRSEKYNFYWERVIHILTSSPLVVFVNTACNQWYVLQENILRGCPFSTSLPPTCTEKLNTRRKIKMLNIPQGEQGYICLWLGMQRWCNFWLWWQGIIPIYVQ